MLPRLGEETSLFAPDGTRVRLPAPNTAARGVDRTHHEAGFTLIELLVVIIVIGILTGIAIPSFLTYQGRGRDAAAQANVRAAIPAIELYFSDNDTYVGMSYAVLTASYDAGLAPIVFPTLAPTTYCIEATVNSHTYSKNGPDADIVQGGC